MSSGAPFVPIQQQLKDDWDNREYAQVISDNIGSIAKFLTQFELLCREKLAHLSDRVTQLEKKIEFIEGRLKVTYYSRLHDSFERSLPRYRLPREKHSTKVMSTAQAFKSSAGKVSSIMARPVKSQSAAEARLAVLESYKELQRLAPKFWWDFQLTDMPLGVLRGVLKQQYTANGSIKDIRVIDRKVAETKQHMYAIRWAFYNPDHVRNYLFRENVEAAPKDFLSKFLSGK